MKSKTSTVCKIASIVLIILTLILCITVNGFVKKLEIAGTGALTSLLFISFAIIIDKILKTMQEQKRIYDSIDALSEKINIMLGLDKTTVAIENLKAEQAPVYADIQNPIITSEEDLTWTCPECGYDELSVNTVCTKCGHDRKDNE